MVVYYSERGSWEWDLPPSSETQRTWTSNEMFSPQIFQLPIRLANDNNRSFMSFIKSTFQSCHPPMFLWWDNLVSKHHELVLTGQVGLEWDYQAGYSSVKLVLHSRKLGLLPAPWHSRWKSVYLESAFGTLQDRNWRFHSTTNQNI